MTKEQYIEAIAIHNRLVALQDANKQIKNGRDYRLSYRRRMSDNSYGEAPEWVVQQISDILDRHDAMIREEIDREIKELTERIKQI